MDFAAVITTLIIDAGDQTTLFGILDHLLDLNLNLIDVTQDEKIIDPMEKTKGEPMLKKNTLKEAGLFFGLTLGLSWFVFWGPLAIFSDPDDQLCFQYSRADLGHRPVHFGRICPLPGRGFIDVDPGRDAWPASAGETDHPVQDRLALVSSRGAAGRPADCRAAADYPLARPGVRI
jgi:hypothetical protein